VSDPIRRTSLAFALAVALAGCDRHRDDRGAAAELAGHVEIELHRSGIDGVEVAVDGDVFRLRGMVANPSERARAVHVAKRSSGVRRVDNQVAVAQTPVLTSASVEGRAAAEIESRARAAGIGEVRVVVEQGAFVVHGAVPLAKHDDLMRIAVEEAPSGYHVVDRTGVE
jgi:osmotically-inducible protein OsmY